VRKDLLNGRDAFGSRLCKALENRHAQPKSAVYLQTGKTSVQVAYQHAHSQSEAQPQAFNTLVFC